MKRLSLGMFAAALSALLSNTASAQPGGAGGFGGGGTSLTRMLHTNKPLQEELKLADDQIEKFKEYDTKNNPAPMGMGMRPGAGGGIGGIVNGLGAGGTSDLDSIESLEEQLAKMKERVEFTKKNLSKEQYERFTQLENQRLAQRAFTTPRIAKELKITDDQKKRFTEINTDFNKEIQTLMQGAFQGGFDQDKLNEANKKRTELNNFAVEAMEKELTDNQKSTWSKMIGKKFDVSKLVNPPRMRMMN